MTATLDRPLPLVLHAGAHEVSREEVFQTKTPESTKTFTPIPHGSLISLVTTALVAGGQKVVREAFGLWRDGQRLFGVLEIRNSEGHDDYGLLVGIRNSHDQTFAASIALGSRVFICDNMAFSGEVRLQRRHTPNIMRDLPGLVTGGIAKLHALRGYQDKRIEAYKASDISDAEAHDLVIRGLRAGVINVQRVAGVVDQWYKPNHDEFADRTAWSLFNAFTETLKGSGADLQPRTLRLHGLMDQAVGLPSFASITEAEIVNEGDGVIEVDVQEIARNN